ncbi:MAG: cytochrome b N-terminal domain-containing protein [Planctomycetota bacterium]|nr:cytochrome b N-terminal domain-containing protein [Planctomycetota bacterium]
MIRTLLAWLDDRTGYAGFVHEALYERVPGGARWRYVWGSTLVFTFSVQLITGFFLWTAYSPSANTAWESVYYIQNEMTFGSVVRGLHHFTAQLMIVLMAVHLVQVIIDGAYKAPREVNFWLGLVLMQIVLGLSLTGYLLPWDQKGYYATQVSTKIMGNAPLVGQQAQELIQGGPKYGHHTLTRFFALHAGLLPASLVAFLGLHLYVFRRHGLTVKDPKHAPETTFWPDQVLKDGVACLAVLLLVLGLSIWKGAELAAPANPSENYAAARPEWYFLFLFRFLKFEVVEHFGLAFGSIYVPGALMGVVAAMPLLGRWAIGHKFNVAFTWAVTIAIGVLTMMAFYEDGRDADHQAAIREAHRDAERIKELASGPNKIPVSGAVTLLREDPFTQGPRLFAKHCKSCHRFNGHDGRGRPVYAGAADGGQVRAASTAVDLGNFGSSAWMRSVVVDYSNHFSALKNAQWFKSAKGEEVLNPDESEMADWSGDAESLGSDENKENVEALVAFLVGQAGHNTRSGTHVDQDKAKFDRGRVLAVEGDWAGAINGTSCADCHSTIGESFSEIGDDDAEGYPNLSGYGSAAWLKSFLSDPGSAQHYGEKNQMPAYAERMTPSEMGLLVRWLTGDYAETELKPYEDQREKPKAAATKE